MIIDCNKVINIQLTTDEAMNIIKYVNSVYPEYIKNSNIISDEFAFLMDLKDELARSLS